MASTSGKPAYSAAQIALHWVIALLIAANWLFSEDMQHAFDAKWEGEGVMGGWQASWHVWAGVTVLALVLLRLVLRLAQGAPELGRAPSLADRLATLGHWLLYALMLAVPALGAVAWFIGIEDAADAHVLAMNAMMVLILGHAAIALVHHYLLKDGLLARMVPTLR